jgi:hypothetical protein
MSENPFATPQAELEPGPQPDAAVFLPPRSAILFGLGAAATLDVMSGVAQSLFKKPESLALSALGQTLMLLVCGVLWGLWSVRAAHNARTFSDAPFEFSPSSTIWWFFVPFLNLVRPYQAIKEIDLASMPDEASGNASSIIGGWWALWIISRIVLRLADAGVPALLGYGLDAITAVAAIMMIRKINENQLKKHAQIR